MSGGDVEVGTGKAASRFLKRDWPNTEGLVAGTTKQEGTKVRELPRETKVSDKLKVLL